MDGQRIYNTGRVEIGKQYSPPVRVDMDADAQRLQTALLNQRGDMSVSDKAVVAACLLGLVAVVAMDAAGWIQ